MGRADRLAETPLLRGASPEALAQLLESAREVRLAAREWLFHDGDVGDRLFVVLSGRLHVVGAEGRLLREVGAGAVLGELGVLTGAPRSASARAVRDSRLLELDAGSFTRLVAADGAFALSVARELARQLQASGGLALPETRPRVFGVLSAGAGDGAAFAAQLESCLSRWGSVETLDGGEAEPERYAEVLDAAESRHAYVLLLDGAGAWGDFVQRQSDRLVLVGAGEPPAGLDSLDAPELVLVGVEPSRVAAWLDAVRPRTHHVVAAGAPAQAARVARRLTARSLGLVLSGGGARGFAHVGVLGALAEAGFELDRVGGCSMGSFVAALAALGRPADEIRSHCADEFVRRSPFNDYTLPRVALIRSRKARAMLERVFGPELVEATPASLYTVSADLLSSRVVVHRRGPILEAVGASMSIPGVAPPVRRAGRLLVDGGVLNNLPVDHMADTDEGPIVAVDVIRRLDAGEDGEPPLLSIAETLARATVLGSVERAERNRRLALLLVTPEVERVGLREWSALDAAVEAGRAAALRALEDGGAETLRAALDARH